MLIDSILVFIAMVLTDAFWTLYFIATKEEKAVNAGFWSMMIIILGGFSTVSIVENTWNMIPAALGAFVGTYAVVRFHQVKNQVS